MVLYRNPKPVNFHLRFCELHSDSSIIDKNTLFENYIPKCYKAKIILISFNCFSEYCIQTPNDSSVPQTLTNEMNIIS